MTNLLFVCTNNKHRSVTAAEMLCNVHETKSAGLSPTCENPVTEELVEWADKVYCSRIVIERSFVRGLKYVRVI